MERWYVVAVDIGTQGTKTALYDQGLQPIAQAFEPSRLLTPAPGVAEQEPEDVYQSVVRTIRRCMDESGARASDVLAIAMDGQMGSLLGIDRAGHAITPVDSWLDNRCQPYMEQLKAQDERFIRATGSPVTYHHGPKLLWWRRERPDVYARIDKFVQMVPYVALRLCGAGSERAYLDDTDMAFAGFADQESLSWSRPLCDDWEVDIGKLPCILAPWETIGALSPGAAADCGLSTRTAVLAGCGDQAACALGAGMVEKGLCFDVAGTASVFALCTDAFLPDVKHRTMLSFRSVLPGLWLSMAYANGAGLCLKWFRDLGLGEGLTYAQLDAEAAAVAPGSDGLLFCPHFAGQSCPNEPSARGGYVGLGFHHTRGHLYRAILEAVAYEYAGYARIMNDLAGEDALSRVTVVGGGAESAVFTQIKADVLGKPYRALARRDGPLLADAVVAAYGCGAIPDMKRAIQDQLAYRDAIEPNPARHPLYARYAELYREQLAALLPLCRALQG